MAGAIYPQTPANVGYVNGEYGTLTVLLSDLTWPSSSGTVLPVKDTPCIYKAGTLNIPCTLAANPDALQDGAITQPNAAAYTAGLLEYIAINVSLGAVVFNLAVYGANSSGDAALSRFATLYINTTTGLLSGSQLGGQPFGIALAAVGSGVTTKIPVKIFAPPAAGAGVGGGALADGASITSTTDESLTIAQLWNRFTQINASKSSAQALGIPGATNFPVGTRIRITRLVNASAVTVTPAAGTIAGGASTNTLDAVGDFSEFVANGTDWARSFNIIA